MLPASRLLRQDIGYTQNVTASYTIGAQDVADLQGIGDRVVIRYQQKMIQVETSNGVFNWVNSDASVKTANDNGIDLLYQVQTSPGWLATLDGLGCNFTLQQTLTHGTIYTALTVSALNSEAFLVPGVTYAINFGGGTQEIVTIAAPNSGTYYGSGTTSININSFNPVNTHNAGEQMYESTQGAIYPTAALFASFMGTLAARYNGTAGHGLVTRYQVGNEEADSNNRFGSQGATANWDGSQSWDNGGAIAALWYNQCRTAILDANPQATVCFAAVRRTSNTAQINGMSPCIQHIQNWVQGAAKFLNCPVDEADFHDYHGADANFDGALIADPTQDTFFDVNQTQVNSPSIQRQLNIMAVAWNSQTLKQHPRFICGEFGWDLYDDGSGFNFTLNQALTSGTVYGSIAVLALAQQIPNAEPVWIDNTQTTNFEKWYTFGIAAINATSINLTTDPRGNGTSVQAVVQMKPVAAFNHNSGVQCYAQKTTDVVTATQAAYYYEKLINAMRGVNGDSYCFTITPASTVSGGPPWPQQSTGIKSIVQVISSVLTFLAPYQTLQRLAQKRW